MRRNSSNLSKRGRLISPPNPPKPELMFSAVVGTIRPASTVARNASGSLTIWGATGSRLGTIPVECSRVNWPGYLIVGG